MKRRGFLGSLLAAIASPALPALPVSAPPLGQRCYVALAHYHQRIIMNEHWMRDLQIKSTPGDTIKFRRWLPYGDAA